MPSSPTPLLNIEQQAAGENLNVWGDPNLNQALQRLTEAIAATTAIAAYPVTLTSTNYSANQARNMILSCTGAGGTITIPGQSKLYIVRNASSGNVTITTGGGATAVVSSGDIVPVICDGTNCTTSKRQDFQNSVIRNLANGVNAQDAVNKQQLDATLAAAQAYTDATAFASASLPGQAGQAGKFLTTNGTSTAWADVYPAFAGTTDFILYSTGSASAWGSPAVIRGKLSLGGAALLNVGTTAGTVAAGNDLRIVNAAQTTGAVFTGAISGPAATFSVFNGALAGNASSASVWQTARNLSLTGDATATMTGVDGSGNVSAPLTLANTGVVAGTYGNLTIDAKGRVTSASSVGTIYASGTFVGATGATVAGSGVSISRLSAGTYTATLSPAAPNANYRIFLHGQNTASLFYKVVGTGKTTTGFGISVQNTSALDTDPVELYIQIVI